MIQSGQAKMNESSDRVISLDSNQTFYAKEEEKWYGQETLDAPLEVIAQDVIDHVETREGIEVNGRILVDKTAQESHVNSVTVPDSLGADILANIALANYWYWGPEKHLNPPTPEEEKAFKEKWLQVQQGLLPASGIAVDPHAWEAGVPGKKMKRLLLVLFPGQGTVEPGVITINNVEIVILKGSDDDGFMIKRANLPRETMTDNTNAGGQVFETEIEENTLRYFVGTDNRSVEGNKRVEMARNMYFVWMPNGWIFKNHGTQSVSIDWNQQITDTAVSELQGLQVK